MNTFPKKLMFASALVTVLITGCGGGGSDPIPTPPPSPTANIDMSVTALFAYISGLISGTGENAEPAEINGLTLAVDDTKEPTPLD